MSVTGTRRRHEIDVVILGGGYAGMLASNRLWGSLTADERSRVRIRMVNPADRFVHRITLHQHAAGSRGAELPLRSMIHDEVEVVIGRATHIDPQARIVTVESADGGQRLSYDRLVYAVGSSSATGVSGVEEFAVTIGDIDGATRIARRLASGEVRRVCVVGGGPTGVETAAELAEAHPAVEVTLLAGSGLLKRFRPRARRSVRRALARLGVVVAEGTRVLEVTAAGVLAADGARFDAELVVWAAGFEVPDLAERSGLPVDEQGRLLVDEALVSPAHPSILGAGDAVRPPDSVASHLPMGARVALPMGGAAADSILAQLRRRDPPPISIGLLGPSLSLGRRAGYIQLTRADDSPIPIAFAGRLGALIKAWVCRMTIETPRRERVEPGAYRVPPGPSHRWAR